MQIKEIKSTHTRVQVIRYCQQSKEVLDKYLPKYYVDDVTILAKERGVEFTVDQIRNVRNGRTPNKPIMELLVEVAILCKMVDPE